MLAGADFKTSTGKIDVAATPEAAVVMCQAIKDYFDKTAAKVSRPQAASARPKTPHSIYTVVEEILGKGVAHDRPVPHRCLLGRQQPPLGHRGQRGSTSDRRNIRQHDMQQFLRKELLFSYSRGRNTGRLNIRGARSSA